MRRPGTRAALIAIWVGVVVACASLIWVVIDQAGRDVSQTTRADGGGVLAPVATGTLPAGPGTSTSHPAPPGSPGPGTRSVPTSPAGSQASLVVAGGSVGISCTGERVVLQWATPRNGWSFQVHPDDDRLEVTFRPTQGDGESEVTGSCRGGVARLENH